ncbi:MAG TPA: DUF4214 domain-containing protein [Gemmataceae bacterium]|jgi:hypothetical protein|nr:DUF4214 domain-containing protein [Gemmataceae bacterium]
MKKRPYRNPRRASLLVEQLEVRQVLTGFQPSAAEQLMLEQLDDIRANPAAYGAAIGVNLNGVTPAQPLAFDPSLIEAAQQHAQDMNNRAYVGQTTPDNIDPGQRLTAVGFPWTSWSESNQAGTTSVNSAVALQSLVIDSSSASLAERTQLLGLNAVSLTQGQVGIGIVQGGTGPLANYYTIDTAATNDGNPLLTGVVFQDNEGSGHYDVGEGAGNVLITAVSGSHVYKVSTWGSGGYTLEVTPGTYTVTASGGGLTAPVTMTVTVSTANARLNFVLPPGSVQPQNSSYVEMLYRDVLGRVPAGNEVAGWVTDLNNGQSQSAMAGGFLYSAEYSYNLVSQWYQQYLHRAADSGGLNGFAQALQNGVSEDALRAAILASPEYFAVHGNNTQGFVQAIYKDVLGRTASTGEVGTWLTTALHNRLAVINGFFQSLEFRNDEANAFYGTYLRRNADSGGLNHFVTLLGQGVDERQIIQSLVASPEYFNNSRDILWLRSIYQDVLGRNGDNANELGSWLASERQANNRLAVATGFLTSPEQANRVVTALYQLLLGRAPDSSGLATYMSLLQSTGQARAVIVQIASSTEYYGLHLSNDTQFIQGLYQNLLGRNASDTEVQTWLNEINTGKTHAQVVADFLAAPAYQSAYAANLFAIYLQRPPSKMEVDQVVNQLQSSASDAAIAASILASDEYYLDAANR